jgi:hypothetical protein
MDSIFVAKNHEESKFGKNNNIGVKSQIKGPPQ